MKRSFSLFSMTSLCLAMAFTQVSCSDDNEPEKVQTVAETYAGTYAGTITLNVSGQYTYDADINCVITPETENTITVTLPEYQLTQTMMGDLSLGAVTITGIEYNEDKGGFYRSFGGEGLTQSMNGTVYPLNDPTSILVKKSSDGTITIDYPFTLGRMPLPLTATFSGQKK